MSSQQLVQKSVPPIMAVQGRYIQRKCDCGTHTMSDNECTSCANKKGKLQRKLSIGASNDPLEHEADRVADQVMRMSPSSSIARTAPKIQHASTNGAGSDIGVPASVNRVLSGSGAQMQPALRHDMEQRFGHDFSHVQIHTGEAANKSTKDINALAYTVGNNIVFGAGHYNSNSGSGRRLLAHELTHTIQQNNGSLLQRSCGPSAIGSVAGCTGMGGEDILDVGESSNSIYLFSQNCDEFRPGEELRLETFASTISSDATVEIHGFSSEEGDPEFNDNLSCSRALIAASVISLATPATLELFKRGATPGVRGDRRSVVIRVLEPGPEPTPTNVITNNGPGEITLPLVSANRSNVPMGNWLHWDRIEWERLSERGRLSTLSQTNTFIRAAYYNTENLHPERYRTIRERHDYYDVISYVLQHDRNTPQALRDIRFFHATTAVTGSPGIGTTDTPAGAVVLQEQTRQIFREVNAELFELNMNVIRNLIFNWREPRDPQSPTNRAINAFSFDIRMVETEQEQVENYIARNRMRFTNEVVQDINATLDPNLLERLFNPSSGNFEWARSALGISSLDFTNTVHRQAIGFASVHSFHRKSRAEYLTFMQSRSSVP